MARRAEPRPLPRRRWGPAGSWDVDPASSVCPSRPCHCVPGSWGFLVPARAGRCGSRHLESAVGSGGTGRTGRRERRGEGNTGTRRRGPCAPSRFHVCPPPLHGRAASVALSLLLSRGVSGSPAPQLRAGTREAAGEHGQLGTRWSLGPRGAAGSHPALQRLRFVLGTVSSGSGSVYWETQRKVDLFFSF